MPSTFSVAKRLTWQQIGSRKRSFIRDIGSAKFGRIVSSIDPSSPLNRNIPALPSTPNLSDGS